MTRPKYNEERMERILNAWRTLAPDKVFGGHTLAMLEETAEPALAARQRINDLNDQLAQAQADRDTADAAFAAKAQLVVNGVLADAAFGPDSALYEAFGYVRKSERRTGLTRKRTEPATT